MRRATAIITSTIVAASIALPNSIAYADTLGKISANADIQCAFDGEIYVIVKDTQGNRKLILLSSSNSYQGEANNLNAGTYEISEIHIFDTTNDSRKELPNADYSLEYTNLNISEANQNAEITVTLTSLDKSKPIKDSKEEQNISTIEENKETDEDYKPAIPEDTEKTKEEKEKEKKSIERRKKFYFINFLIDAFLIVGLGAIWFFKVKGKDNKGDEE